MSYFISGECQFLFCALPVQLCEEICAHSEKYLPAMSNRCPAEIGIRVINGVIEILSGDRFVFKFDIGSLGLTCLSKTWSGSLNIIKSKRWHVFYCQSGLQSFFMLVSC